MDDEDETEVTLCVEWSEDDPPQKKKTTLEKIFQTWVNKNRFNGDCTVLKVSEDGRAAIKIKPAAAVTELQDLHGQTLSGRDGRTVKIMFVSPKLTELKTQTPDNASMTPPPSFGSETQHVKHEEESNMMASTHTDNASVDPPASASEPQQVKEQLSEQSNMTASTLNIPMHHYWYVNHAYQEEIKRLEKASGTKIMAEVKLMFEVQQKDGNPDYAFSEFANLVQKCSAESRGFSVPLDAVNAEGWRDTVKIIQRPENKLLVALTSEEMTVCGPRQSQDAIRKSLKAAQKAAESAQASPDASLNTAVSSEKPSTSRDGKAEDGDEVQVLLSVKWSEGSQPQKCKLDLQRALRNWDSNRGQARNKAHDYTVLKVSEDGRAVIRIKPSPAASELQQLSGQTLKGTDGKTVTITSVSLTLAELEGETPDKTSGSKPQHVKGQHGEPSMPKSTFNVLKRTDSGSVTPPPSSVSEPQREEIKHIERVNRVQMNAAVHVTFEGSKENEGPKKGLDRPPSSGAEKEHEPLDGQSGSSNLAAVSATGEETNLCILPVAQFCYVNQVFKEKIKHIESNNRVRLTSEVCVTFEGDPKDKDPKKALSDFVDLVQTCLADLDDSVIPFKSPDPEDLKDALKIVQNKENNILVSLSAGEISVFGPRQIQNVVSKSLKAAQKYASSVYPSAGESRQASEDTSINIAMSVKDRIVDKGLTMKESYWKWMDTHKIKETHHKKSGRSPSMESHATRALPHQYQKTATSTKNFAHHGTAGFSSSGKSMNSSYQSEAASSRPEMNGKSRHNALDTKASREEGATAADNEDENCPICRDRFTNKKQLKCKHEFCEECLEQSIKYMGSTCPVCKDVFGMIEGNQPDGRMSCRPSLSSLPGFPGCGTIVIDYYFPSGKQTEKHPNPGRHYDGTSRTAYLPDNREGKEVLRLLERAFKQKLTFTVGTSATTGRENQVTWNGIHHKTSTHGGPQSFGYPDPDYLRRVREQLKAKGIE